jgi:urease accessory protein
MEAVSGIRNARLCRAHSGRGLTVPLLPARPMEGSDISGTRPRHTVNSSDRNLERAEGICRIVAEGSERGTRIMDVYQKAPTRVLFPRIEQSRAVEAVLVNTSGGIAGGDRLQSSITALSGASLTVTTQTAERIYRAIDTPATIVTNLNVGDAARLAWLPQETIVFNRARVIRRTEIEISSGAEFLALESLVLGRTAHGEKLIEGSIIENWLVRKDGRLVWGDTLRLTDEVFLHLPRKALFSDSIAIATLLYSGANLDRLVQAIRDLPASCDCLCGATIVAGIAVGRFAASSSAELKTTLRCLLQELGKETPGPFGVPKMWSC